jgi:hypothetical protein
VEQLVAAASVLGMHAPLRLAASVAGVDDPLPVLEQAIAASLLEERLAEREVSFPHPLVQAAVYRQLGPARRAGLHLRAADHAEGEAVRLRHRARAASGPDSVLAGELARLGRRDAASGAWVSAADHLSSAARLTQDRADHEQLILEMVECHTSGAHPASLAATNAANDRGAGSGTVESAESSNAAAGTCSSRARACSGEPSVCACSRWAPRRDSDQPPGPGRQPRYSIIASNWPPGSQEESNHRRGGRSEEVQRPS